MSAVERAKALVLLKDGLGDMYEAQKALLVAEAVKLPLAEAAATVQQLHAIGFISAEEFSQLSMQIVTGAAAAPPSTTASAPLSPVASAGGGAAMSASCAVPQLSGGGAATSSAGAAMSASCAVPQSSGGGAATSSAGAGEGAGAAHAPSEAAVARWGAQEVTLDTRVADLEGGLEDALRGEVAPGAVGEVLQLVRGMGAGTLEQLLELESNHRGYSVLDELLSGEQVVTFNRVCGVLRGEIPCVQQKYAIDSSIALDHLSARQEEERVGVSRRELQRGVVTMWGDAVHVLLVPRAATVNFYCEVEPGDGGATLVGSGGEHVLFYLDISASMNHDEAGIYVAPKSPDHAASSMKKARELIPVLAIPALRRHAIVTVVAWNYQVSTEIVLRPEDFVVPQGDAAAATTSGDGDGEDGDGDDRFQSYDWMKRHIERSTSDEVFRAKGGTNIEAALAHLVDSIGVKARDGGRITAWFLTDGEETVYQNSANKPERIPSNPSHPQFRYFNDLKQSGMTGYQEMMVARMQEMHLGLADGGDAVEFHVCHFKDADPVFLNAVRVSVDGHFHAIKDVDRIADEMSAAVSASASHVILRGGASDAEQLVPASRRNGRLCARGTLPVGFVYDNVLASGQLVVTSHKGERFEANASERKALEEAALAGVHRILELEPELAAIIAAMRDNVTPEMIAQVSHDLRGLRGRRSEAIATVGRAVHALPLLQELLEATLENVETQTAAMERLLVQYQKPVSSTYDKVAAKRAEMFSAREQQAIAAGLDSMQVRVGHGFVSADVLDKRVQRLVADHGVRARRMLERVCLLQCTENEATGRSAVSLLIVEGSEYRAARKALIDEAVQTDEAAARLARSQGASRALEERLEHRGDGDDRALWSVLTVTLRSADGGETAAVKMERCTRDVYRRVVAEWHGEAETADVDAFNKRFMDPLSYSGCLDLIGECYTLPARLYVVAKSQSAGLIFNAKEMMHVVSGGEEATSFEYFRLYWRLEAKDDDGCVKVPGTFHAANMALPMAPNRVTNLALANLLTGLVSEFITGTSMAPLPGIGLLYIGYLNMHMRKRRVTGVDVARIADILATIACWVANPRTHPPAAEPRDLVGQWMQPGATIPGRDSSGKNLPVKAFVYMLLAPDGYSLPERFAVLQSECVRRYTRLLLPPTVHADAKLPDEVKAVQQSMREYMREVLRRFVGPDEQLQDDIPVQTLANAERLQALLVGSPTEDDVFTFMADARARRAVVCTVYELLVERSDRAFAPYLWWRNVHRYMAVWAAVGSFPVAALCELFEHFKSVDVFEEHVLQRLAALNATGADHVSFKTTLVSWLQPADEDATAGVCAAAAEHGARAYDVVCVNAAWMPEFGEMLEMRNVSTGEAVNVSEADEATKRRAYLAVWGVFAEQMKQYAWRGRPSTAFNILETDYEIVRALKATDPSPLLERMSQAQVSEYHSALSRRSAAYRAWVPEPEAVQKLGDEDHIKAKQIARVPTSKPRLSLVIIGNVDCGKSTTSGHLIAKMGFVDPRVIRQYEKACRKVGRDTSKYAWIMDQLREERERGVTISVSVWNIVTQNYEVDILDAPGHQDFVKNMAVGAAQADVAVLIVSATPGEFEAGVVRQGMTVQEMVIAYSTGVKQFVVLVNKMDTVDYSQERFEEVRSEVSRHLRKLGVKLETVPFIPCSGYIGVNLTVPPAEEMPWYEGWSMAHSSGGQERRGLTLVEAIDAMPLPHRAVAHAVRIPIQNAFKVSGVGTVATGRVATGVLERGDKVVLMPGRIEAEVTSIQIHHMDKARVGPGDIVGFKVRGVPVSAIHRGMVAGRPNERPLVEVASFVAVVILTGVPNQVRAGYAPFFFCHTGSFSCRFVELIEKSDKHGKKVEKNPEFLKNGNRATVRLVPLKPVCLEPYAVCPQLGRFVIRDSRVTVGVGVVQSVEEHKVASASSTSGKRKKSKYFR